MPADAGSARVALASEFRVTASSSTHSCGTTSRYVLSEVRRWNDHTQLLKAVDAKFIDDIPIRICIGPVLQVAERRYCESGKNRRHDGEDVREHACRTLQGMVLVLISKRLRPALYLW